MDENQARDGTSDGKTATAEAKLPPIRQEEQGQQSRQETTYPTVDCGNCWYHEDALKAASQ